MRRHCARRAVSLLPSAPTRLVCTHKPDNAFAPNPLSSTCCSSIRQSIRSHSLEDQVREHAFLLLCCSRSTLLVLSLLLLLACGYSSQRIASVCAGMQPPASGTASPSPLPSPPIVTNATLTSKSEIAPVPSVHRPTASASASSRDGGDRGVPDTSASRASNHHTTDAQQPPSPHQYRRAPLCIVGVASEVGRRTCSYLARTYRNKPDLTNSIDGALVMASSFDVPLSSSSLRDNVHLDPMHSYRWIAVDENRASLTSMFDELMAELPARSMSDRLEPNSHTPDTITDDSGAAIHPSGCIGLQHIPSITDNGEMLRKLFAQCTLVICCYRFVQGNAISFACSLSIDLCLSISLSRSCV